MNEITLIVGRLGCGKTTLAKKAVESFDKVIVLTNFAGDFQGLKICEYLSSLIEDDACVFVNDDLVTNEIAIRYAYEKGDGLLIIDEAHLYQDSDQLKKVIRYSRHKNLDIILISHSFFDFARLNRQLIHNIIVFQMNEPYELSYIERINENVKPKELQQYEFMLVQGQIPKWLSKKDLLFTKNIFKLKVDEKS